MSLAETRSDGAAVTSDPDQCCVSRLLPPDHGETQTAFGALWIITGLLHIGLSAVLTVTRDRNGRELLDTDSPLWLGVSFIFFGVCCVLAERYPRPNVVLLSGLLNLSGAAMCITAIKRYANGFDDPGFQSTCQRNYNTLNYFLHLESPELLELNRRCEESRDLLLALRYSASVVLVALSFLNLYTGLTSAALSFKALSQGTVQSGKKPPSEETTLHKILYDAMGGFIGRNWRIIAETQAKMKTVQRKASVFVASVRAWIQRR